MKKITALVISAIVVIASIMWAGGDIKSSIPNISVYSVLPEYVNDSIICNGTVEYKDCKEITAGTTSQIINLWVKNGDTVKKGSKLCTLTAGSSTSAISEEDVYSAILNKNYDALKDYAQGTSNDVSPSSFDICSPIDGTIIDISAYDGGVVSGSAVIMKIVSAHSLCVRLPVNESKINDLKIDQSAVITGNGFKNSTYVGKVSHIDQIAQQVSTSAGKETAVNVILDVENPLDDIKAGYSAKCVINTSQPNKKLIVPYDSVTTDDNTAFVYVVDSSSKAQKQNVKTGKEYEKGIEILDGVKNNDMVITEPELVRDNQYVKISY